jgi:hypothetical protein
MQIILFSSVFSITMVGIYMRHSEGVLTGIGGSWTESSGFSLCFSFLMFPLYADKVTLPS